MGFILVAVTFVPPLIRRLASLHRPCRRPNSTFLTEELLILGALDAKSAVAQLRILQPCIKRRSTIR
ncbi:MAG TPA: hypothetical protein PK156_45815 [Polyangium sp.]|nr:hypothetical protein [Polyangium sp.]